MEIIGRNAEKTSLDKIMRSGQPEFLALYGRRRVGKTFLIRQYLKAHIVFDISGTKDGNKREQLANFFDEYLTRTKAQLETRPPTTWREMFRYLANYLAQLPPTPTKHVVFLDEMPWMDTPKSGFMSALEFFWNQHGSRMDNLLLIGCGSASSWIRKHLVNARGGLYNRVTQRMKLKPFNLGETQELLAHIGVHLPHYQILELYMAMGGIPFYLKEVEKGKSSTQVINEICFSPTGRLRDEYDQLYHSLFRDAEAHIAVVETLAASPLGMTRAEIGRRTKLAEGLLSKALEELEESDFITRFAPMLNMKKDAVFKLTDFYSLFYLKFIKPNKDAGRNVWEQLSKESAYATWSGYAFENICMAHTDQIKAALGISGVYTQHSSWLFKGNDELPGAQIDMVIDRADQIVHLCEAKFSRESVAITADYAAKLRLRKSIFKQVTKTNKAVFTLLLSTYPAIQNKYYLEEIDNEITMECLFN